MNNVFLKAFTYNPCDGNKKMTQRIKKKKKITYISIIDVKRSKFKPNSPPKFAPLRIL